VISNSEVVASAEWAQLGYRLIQIDDGWQHAYGDWRPNTKFGSGMKQLSDELAKRGQTTGVWTAPFLVSASSDLAESAPDDWFLRHPVTGSREVDHRHQVFGPMYVLDARKAAVRRHLEETFAGLRTAGIRYFKLDFLYAGAYAGLAALRAGVEAIRRGVGDESYILACGAPLLPMAGLVEGCRIGQDTASPIFNFELGAPEPTTFGDEVRSVGRNLAARSQLRAWFQLDPDVALVGGNLSLGQARQLVTLAALSGGPFFASDNLGALPPERRALLTNPDVLALVGGPPAEPEWEPHGNDLPPAVWRRDDVVAVFNWTGETRTFSVPVTASAEGVHDLWDGAPLETTEGRLQIDVEPSSARLVRVGRRVG
jgi:alpha-galactosidase